MCNAMNSEKRDGRAADAMKALWAVARNARAGDAQLSEAASISADIRAGSAIAHAADVSVG